MTICLERGNIFKQSASRSFTSEISGLRKQYGMRGWRNWQTRTFEVRVVYPWGFESPPSHQKNSTRYRRKFDASWGFLFCRRVRYRSLSVFGLGRGTHRPLRGTVWRHRTSRFRFWRPALFQNELRRHEKSTVHFLHSALKKWATKNHGACASWLDY